MAAYDRESADSTFPFVCNDEGYHSWWKLVAKAVA